MCIIYPRHLYHIPQIRVVFDGNIFEDFGHDSVIATDVTQLATNESLASHVADGSWNTTVMGRLILIHFKPNTQFKCFVVFYYVV